MKEKLKDERLNNSKRYLGTVKNLILQAMIKLIEPSLQIRCREEDRGAIEKMTKDIEKEYHVFMREQTGRAEYTCSLAVVKGSYITDDMDLGCGGIILYTEDNRIVCPNMLSSRLSLAFEECLPTIRNTLFPALSANLAAAK